MRPILPGEAAFPVSQLPTMPKSEEEVDTVMEQARKAGGIVLKQPEKVFWGGYSGYFADPDGYVWEVAYGPNWQFDGQDMLVID